MSSLVITKDTDLAAILIRLAAAGGSSCDVTPGTSLRQAWRDATVVLIDDLEAATVLTLGLPRRHDVVLIGRDLDDATIWGRAVRLGVEKVMFLPEAEPQLISFIRAAVANTEDRDHPVAAWQLDVAMNGTLQSYRDWVRTRRAGRTDEEADSLVTCRHCFASLKEADESPCKESPNRRHEADMVLNEPPPDRPWRSFRWAVTLEVPNDGYCYGTDIGGRLERLAERLLEDRLVHRVTSVSTPPSKRRTECK